MASSESQPGTISPVSFSGQFPEYFRIWIVNTALTIVTLGIYSPWAKVRKLRYFYTHTEVASGTFDFHANPRAILFGRVIALAIAGLYFGSGYLDPRAPFIVILLIFAMIPWLVVRSRIFRMRNTSYRGVRFIFIPDYKEAFKVYYLAALVTVLSLSFATPSAIYMRTKFAVRHTGFGKTRFTFQGNHGAYTSIFWRSVGLSILMALVYMGLMTFVAVYSVVRFRNYTWSTTTLGGNRFYSDLSVREMLAIYLSNALVIVLSVGLMIPWAQIRLARYRAQHMQLELADDWKNYVASGESEGSALGDEIGQAFDVELDLGF